MIAKLTCNACGGKLEITDDIEHFSCSYCGNEWIVNRSGGIVSLRAVEEKLEKIEKQTEEIAKHSKVVADEIRVKKLKEDIRLLKKTLKEEKEKDEKEILALENKIDDVKSDNKNLDFNFEKILLPAEKERQEKARKLEKKQSPFVIALFAIFFASFLLPCWFNKLFLENSSFFYGYIGFFALLFIIGCFTLKNNTLPMSILDKEYLEKKELKEEQKKINLQKVAEIKDKIKNYTNEKAKEIEKEIKQLTTKVKEIEEGFLT